MRCGGEEGRREVVRCEGWRGRREVWHAMVYCLCPPKPLLHSLYPPPPTPHTLKPPHLPGTNSRGIVWPRGRMLFQTGLEQWSVRILLLETRGPRVAEAGHLYLNQVSVCSPHIHAHTHTHTDMSISLQYSAPPPCCQYLPPAQCSCPHQ